MNSIEVREQFANLSGRHDLVTDYGAGTYTDNGADFFLDSGQRMLDRKFTHIKRLAWFKTNVSAGNPLVDFRYCDVIKQVWIQGSDEDRKQLDKKDYAYVRKNYGEPYTDLDQGTPEIYTPRIVNLGPDQIALTSSDYTDEFTYDHEDIIFSDENDHILYTGILIMPPPDETYTVSVLGKFWSPTFTGDTLNTYWTVHHPDILILAAMYSLEGFFRNTEGQKDYMVQIMDALTDVDMNRAEEDAQDLDSMEG